MITLGIGCGCDDEKVLTSANQVASEDIRILCYSKSPL